VKIWVFILGGIMKSSLVTMFDTIDKHYLFDTTTNQIYELDDSDLSTVEKIMSEPEIDSLNSKFLQFFNINGINSKIEELLEDGFKYSSEFLFDENKIYQQIDTKLKHMIFEFTETCNLRCKYCAYSGHYENNRIHSGNSMSYETAIDAVNFFINHSCSSETVTIGFYGGEPLTQFTLLERVVEYIKQFEDRDIEIRISSNGLLLSGKILDWLNKYNNIYVDITLNGPQNIHDNMRVDIKGDGSYSRIVENLIFIRDAYPEFYNKRIHFLSNYLNFNELMMIEEFFFENALLYNKRPIVVSGIDTYGMDAFIQGIIHDENYEKNWFRLIKKYISYINRGIRDTVIVEFVDRVLLSIYNRNDNPDNSSLYYGGCCSPILKRFFVKSNGEFAICEKSSINYTLGNAKTGFNKDSLRKLLEDYKACFNECGQCSARYFCSICFKDIEKNTAGVCEDERNYVKLLLSTYAYILEESPNALEHLSEIKLVD
jgi:uncharacterized protein